jgi:ketosteroid isomerase-like protein
VAPESESAIETIDRGFAAFSSGDLDTFLETMHPEIVWRPVGLFPGLRGSYEGREGMREWWGTFREPWEGMTLSRARTVELDEKSALVELHFEVRGRDGITVGRHLAQRLTVRDGMLYRAEGWPSWEEAAEAMGIESS